MPVGASLFDLFMEPFERALFRSCRRRLIGRAGGRVLELGAGTGVNLPFYDFSRIEALVLSDVELDGPALAARLRRMGEPAAAKKIEMKNADVQALPFAAGIFDSVVATLLFCSVPRPELGLAEIRRVLKPGGAFIFIEHVLPESPRAAALARRVTPAWRRIMSGCRLDRPTAGLLERSGLRLADFERSGLVISGLALN